MVKASQGYREKEKEKSLQSIFSSSLWQGLDARECGSGRETKNRTPPAMSFRQFISQLTITHLYLQGEDWNKKPNLQQIYCVKHATIIGNHKEKRKCDVEKIFGRKKFWLGRKSISNYDLIVVCVYILCAAEREIKSRPSGRTASETQNLEMAGECNSE